MKRNVSGKASRLLSIVFSLGMSVLSLGYVQAQTITPGQIVKWFDADGYLTDSVITESDRGLVGIGTMSPQAKLHVAGSAILVDGAGNEQAYIGGDGAGNDAQFGSLNPSVNGAAVYNNTTGRYMELNASRFITVSDGRLKTNVTPLSDALEKLMQIRGVSFDWNNLARSAGHEPGQREVGVIAQEVEAVFPELVTTSGRGGYKAVDYSRLTAVLIEAVKTLKTENERLKSEKDQEIQALWTRISMLEQRVKESAK